VGATKQPETEVTGKSESTVSKLSTSSLQTAIPKLHQTSVLSLAVDVQVVHAEIWWCLKMIQHHLSMWSAEGLGTLFADMLPESRLIQKFTLSLIKASYVINYALAGYFQRQLQDLQCVLTNQ